MLKVSNISVDRDRVFDAELITDSRGVHLKVISDTVDLHYFACDTGKLIIVDATIEELEALAKAGFVLTTPEGVMIAA